MDHLDIVFQAIATPVRNLVNPHYWMNVFFLASTFLVVGWISYVVQSPPHHQIHHSIDLAHAGRNLGFCLALWDWLFGTLYIPAKEREKLTYGFADHPDAHTVKGELVAPLINAACHLKPMWQRRRGELSPVPVAERERA